jgi:hypothetical protein
VPAEENKGGNVPAHDKHPDGGPYKSGAQRIYITQVFGRQVQGFGTKAFHKGTVGNAEKEEPENQHQLVAPKMQKQQLYG